jgi:hypothetical protein
MVEPLFDKSGSHYNLFRVQPFEGMEFLRTMFPDAKADDMNFVLFSTSGVHGTYMTIEEATDELRFWGPDHENSPTVTFVVVHPRLICLKYGNCQPKTQGDIDFLKQLRQSSWEMVPQIGKA